MKYYKSALYFLFFFFLSSCASASVYRPTAFSNFETLTTYGNERSLSHAEVLSDVTHLFDRLYNYFPFIEISYRVHDINIVYKHQLLMDALLHHQIIDSPWTDKYFFQWLDSHFFYHFNALGHLMIFPIGVTPDTRPFPSAFIHGSNITSSSPVPYRVAYLHIETFAQPQLHILRDTTTIAQFYATLSNYEHLILDLTDNSGGFFWPYFQALMRPLLSSTHQADIIGLSTRPNDLPLSDDFLMPIEKFLSLHNFSYLYSGDLINISHAFWQTHTFYPLSHASPVFNGTLWLLISGNTRSAAETFARRIKDAELGILVGQPTGGAVGDFFGERYIGQLPYSELWFQFDTTNFIDVHGRSFEEHTTQPHVFSSAPLQTALDLIFNNAYYTLSN